MANTLALRRRIKTAQNVSKTTKAMQMIAASWLKRGQTKATDSKPYVDALSKLSSLLASKVTSDYDHPYLKDQSQTKQKLLVIFSPDRGLSGGLLTNLIREYLRFQTLSDYSVITLGKRIEKYVLKSKNKLIASFPLGTPVPTIDMIYPISKLIDQQYLSKSVSSVEVLFTNFQSVFSQTPTVSKLLPLEIATQKGEEGSFKNRFELFEPSVEKLIPPLLKRYIETVLFQYLMESYVSDQAARMIAMQNATDNAKDMIEQLTLEYNKARQARITSEILDITGSTVAIYG